MNSIMMNCGMYHKENECGICLCWSFGFVISTSSLMSVIDDAPAQGNILEIITEFQGSEQQYETRTRDESLVRLDRHLRFVL